MNRVSRFMCVLSLGILVVAGQPAASQDLDRSQAGKIDDVTSGANVRASQIIGMKIQNPNGNSLGSVNDLVIDATNGEIRYVAVSYGGVLAIGDKLFAVPWEAFTVRRAADSPDYHLVLNATEEQLKSATGFDQDRWPNFADPQFTAGLDAHYGVGQRRERRRSALDVEVGAGGVKVDVDADRRKRDRQ